MAERLLLPRRCAIAEIMRSCCSPINIYSQYQVTRVRIFLREDSYKFFDIDRSIRFAGFLLSIKGLGKHSEVIPWPHTDHDRHPFVESTIAYLILTSFSLVAARNDRPASVHWRQQDLSENVRREIQSLPSY